MVGPYSALSGECFGAAALALPRGRWNDDEEGEEGGIGARLLSPSKDGNRGKEGKYTEVRASWFGVHLPPRDPIGAIYFRHWHVTESEVKGPMGAIGGFCHHFQILPTAATLNLNSKVDYVSQVWRSERSAKVVRGPIRSLSFKKTAHPSSLVLRWTRWIRLVADNN